MMYIHQDSGLINVAYFKFDIDDAKGMCKDIYVVYTCHISFKNIPLYKRKNQ